MKSKPAVLSNADRCVLDSGEWAAPVDSSVQAGVIRLDREKVIRLEKHSKVKTVEINRGVVWLTGAPANGDVLLQAGDRFELQDSWPYLIQAMETAELALVQSGEHEKHLTFKFVKRPPSGAVKTAPSLLNVISRRSHFPISEMTASAGLNWSLVRRTMASSYSLHFEKNRIFFGRRLSG